jgi:hypothetical protein
VGDKEMVVSMRQYFIDMTTAALDPSKESQLEDAYKDWMKLPTMSSPAKTIAFIRKVEIKK